MIRPIEVYSFHYNAASVYIYSQIRGLWRKLQIIQVKNKFYRLKLVEGEMKTYARNCQASDQIRITIQIIIQVHDLDWNVSEKKSSYDMSAFI